MQEFLFNLSETFKKMSLSDIIINDVSIQPVTQKIKSLKKIFANLTYSHLPVARDGIYIGSISETDVRCFDSEKTLEDYLYTLTPFFVKENESLLNILRIFAANDTNLLPVLEEETNAYLGYFELIDIMAVIEKAPFFGEEGNIIVVEKGVKDYSFSEISQIVESNDGKIYGSYISNLSDDIVQITIKIGQSLMSEILQTFRRYDYKIISEHEEDRFLQNLKERSDYLNKYLNI